MKKFPPKLSNFCYPHGRKNYVTCVLRNGVFRNEDVTQNQQAPQLHEQCTHQFCSIFIVFFFSNALMVLLRAEGLETQVAGAALRGVK